jgi:SAM-dependent methyltransferase
VGFDRAAEEYDLTRSLPEAAMRRMVQILVEELRGRGRALEIGIGTGRVGLALHERAIGMAGVDISAGMLARLVAKAGGRPPFPLARADAVALPFRTGSFGAALAAHVLHLIPPWKRAVAELARVVRSGGLVLVDPGGFGAGWIDELNDRFAEEAGFERGFPGMNDPEELHAEMAAMGATMRRLPGVVEEREITIARYLEWMERGAFSMTWQVPDEQRVRATAAVRRWAEERYGDVGRMRSRRREIVWRAFDLP